MSTSGEPSGYYPMDSNGLAVQSELSAPCVCPVVDIQAPMACPPLGYGGCENGDSCEHLAVFGINEFCRDRKRKKTYEMCLDFCKVFANAYCKGAGVGIDPWVGRICDVISKKGCGYLCKETNLWEPFTKCWVVCPKVTKPGSPDCVDCCKQLCKWKDGEVQKGGLARCYKECERGQPEPD